MEGFFRTGGEVLLVALERGMKLGGDGEEALFLAMRAGLRIIPVGGEDAAAVWRAVTPPDMPELGGVEARRLEDGWEGLLAGNGKKDARERKSGMDIWSGGPDGENPEVVLCEDDFLEEIRPVEAASPGRAEAGYAPAPGEGGEPRECRSKGVPLWVVSAGVCAAALAVAFLMPGIRGNSGITEATSSRASEATPSEPSVATPSGASEMLPSRPSEATPSGPSEATPSRPSEATPSRPSEATPSRPSEATPSRPSEATPSRPSEATPSRPSVATSFVSSQETPSGPSEAPPSRPSEATPSGPSEVPPSGPSVATPSGPSETTPSRLSEATPPRPTEVKPPRPSVVESSPVPVGGGSIPKNWTSQQKGLYERLKNCDERVLGDQRVLGKLKVSGEMSKEQVQEVVNFILKNRKHSQVSS